MMDAAARAEFSVVDDFVEIVMRGPIAADDYHAFARRFFNDERISTSLSGLLDLREAQVDTSFDELVDFLGVLRNLPRNSHGRFAIVAPDPVGFGVSRIFASLQGFMAQLRVFTRYEEACAWLHEDDERTPGACPLA